MSYVSPAPRGAKGYEQLTVSTSSVALASVPDGANYVELDVQDAGLRWRDDGTAPTSTVGRVLNVNDVLRYPGSADKLRFIRSGASDAKVNATYYKA